MISFLYSISIIITITAYLPQIITLLRARSRCEDISLLTWFAWTLATIISLLYAIYEIYDLKLIIASSAYMTLNITIIAITLYKRKKYAQIK